MVACWRRCPQARLRSEPLGPWPPPLLAHQRRGSPRSASLALCPWGPCLKPLLSTRTGAATATQNRRRVSAFTWHGRRLRRITWTRFPQPPSHEPRVCAHVGAATADPSRRRPIQCLCTIWHGGCKRPLLLAAPWSCCMYPWVRARGRRKDNPPRTTRCSTLTFDSAEDNYPVWLPRDCALMDHLASHTLLLLILAPAARAQPSGGAATSRGGRLRQVQAARAAAAFVTMLHPARRAAPGAHPSTTVPRGQLPAPSCPHTHLRVYAAVPQAQHGGRCIPWYALLALSCTTDQSHAHGG